MRRLDRQIVNGALIVGSTKALVDILMQWIEHKDKGIDFTWDSALLPRDFIVWCNYKKPHSAYTLGKVFMIISGFRPVTV